MCSPANTSFLDLVWCRCQTRLAQSPLALWTLEAWLISQLGQPEWRLRPSVTAKPRSAQPLPHPLSLIDCPFSPQARNGCLQTLPHLPVWVAGSSTAQVGLDCDHRDSDFLNVLTARWIIPTRKCESITTQMPLQGPLLWLNNRCKVSSKPWPAR